jgi:hypothetical protein
MVIFGAVAVGMVNEAMMAAALDRALTVGVNHIDIASTNGEAACRSSGRYPPAV